MDFRIATPDSISRAQRDVPLCVDLDGTLIKTDILWESLFALVKSNPVYVLLVPFWLLKGRAYLKQEIARRVAVDVSSLPYHSELQQFLVKERQHGRPVVLVTGSNIALARRIADHLGTFTDVFASDGYTNLSGGNKLRLLQERFGSKKYDYAANAAVDLKIWLHANQAIVVNASQRLVTRTQKLTQVGHIFDDRARPLPTLLKAIRIHHWAKNSLMAVPLILSHNLANSQSVLEALYAFFAFSLCASSGYLLNDLMDLEADRHDSKKRHRPLASGDLSLGVGILLLPVLLTCGVAVALLLPFAFLQLLIFYFLLTVAYSFYLKQFVLVDVITLAGLYTLRIYAGSVAIGVETSKWLLAFSMFMFFSLALMKRFSELRKLALQNEESARGRGYLAGDLPHIASMGVAGGYMTVLVLALYVNSQEVTVLYSRPDWLWLICPLMLYWISRAWLLAYRGRMEEDPVVFALHDRKSWILGLMMGLIMILAA